MCCDRATFSTKKTEFCSQIDLNCWCLSFILIVRMCFLCLPADCRYQEVLLCLFILLLLAELTQCVVFMYYARLVSEAVIVFTHALLSFVFCLSRIQTFTFYSYSYFFKTHRACAIFYICLFSLCDVLLLCH